MKRPTAAAWTIATTILLTVGVMVVAALTAGPSWADNSMLAQLTSPSPTISSEATTGQVETCITRMAIVRSPEPPLSVYSLPSTERGNVVGQLQSGTIVIVAAEQNGWFQISQPIAGWIIKQRTESGCNELVEQVRPDAVTSAPFTTQQRPGILRTDAQPSTTLISDRFIGTGTHTYRFPAEKGQVMNITRQAGIFPSVKAPDGSWLLEEREESRSAWSQVLPQTGTYLIQLDSNYKGYTYRFQVEIRNSI